MGNRNEVGKKGNGKLGNLPSCRIMKKFILNTMYRPLHAPGHIPRCLSLQHQP